MGRTIGIVAGLVLCATIAHAGPKLFVTRAESSVDWATRSQVEATVLGLARNVDRGAALGDATFDDLASTVGCVGNVESCKAVVLDTLAIDEIVVISIAPDGASVKVTVRRASKGGATRTATTIADRDKPDAAVTAGIGPLFGATRVVAPITQPRPAATQPPPATAIVIDNGRPPTSAPPPTTPPATSDAPPPPPPDTTVATAAAPTVTAPDDVVTEDRPRGRGNLYLGGMIGGGALAVVGLALWQKASGISDDIQGAPNRTRADVDRLLDLEARGDRYAFWGNVAVLGGVAIAGVSGYLYWRSRRSTRSTAHLTPVILDGGGGVAFTLEVP